MKEKISWNSERQYVSRQQTKKKKTKKKKKKINLFESEEGQVPVITPWSQKTFQTGARDDVSQTL